MKKLVELKSLAAGVLIGVLATGTISVSAAAVVKNLQATYSVNSVIVDGKALSFDEESKPFVVDGKTFLPVRAISEALDKDVKWDGNTGTITISAKSKETATTAAPSQKPTENFTYLTKDMIAGVTGASDIQDWGTELKDNVGRNHENGAVYTTKLKNEQYRKSHPSFFPDNNEASIGIGLMGEYKRFTGLYAITDKYKYFKNDYSVIVLADGKEIHSFTLKASMVPQKLDFDVTGVQQLTVNIIATTSNANDKTSKDNFYINWGEDVQQGFADVKLYK